MMKYLCALFFFISCFVGNSQDYYWVGDGGDWTDLNHWATSSGGSTLHTELPGPENDVYFDKKSFSMSSQEVYLNQDSLSCKSLVLEGVEFKPSFRFTSFFDGLYIYGDFISTSDLNWSFVNNFMVGSNNPKLLINGSFFSGTVFLDSPNSSTIFELESELEVGELRVINGEFDTKNFNMYVNDFRVGTVSVSDKTAKARLNNSYIETQTVVVGLNGELETGESVIKVYDGPGNSTNLFFGGGAHFHHVIFEGVIDRIKDNNSFELFSVEPASSLSFEHGDTQKATEFRFSGSSAAPISIDSRSEGEVAYLEQESGSVNGNYLILKDNVAQGGATFNAFNSIDNGNVQGWNIEATVSEDYYWIGGSGNWSDLSHWAKTSGGSDMHFELPSAIDNVIFDNNSAISEGDVIDIDLDAIFINDFIMDDLATGTTIKIKSGSEGKIDLYGNATFSEGVNLHLKEVNFVSEGDVFLTSNGTGWGNSSYLRFIGSGNYTLVDQLKGDEISVSGGNFNSNGQEIIATHSFSPGKLNDAEINLDNSKLTLVSWIPSGSDVNMSLENTEITCNFIFYGRGFDYSKVNFAGRNWVYGPFHVNDLVFSPGAEILIFPGDTVYFDELEAVGTEADSIILMSREEGEHAYLSKADGEVDVSFLHIRDNHAIGGAVFNAHNSYVHAASSEGWNNTTSSFDALLDLDLTLFPNPTAGQLSIHGLKDVDFNYELFDLSGKLVQNGILSSDLTLDVFQSGIYIFSIAELNLQERIILMRE